MESYFYHNWPRTVCAAGAARPPSPGQGGQSAARRWATLSVVLADENASWWAMAMRIWRASARKCSATPRPQAGREKTEPALDLPGKQLNELADVLKNFVICLPLAANKPGPARSAQAAHASGIGW